MLSAPLAGALLASLVTASAGAQTDSFLAVVGFGDCRDPALAGAVRGLRRELGPRALDEATTAAPGGPVGAPIEEIRRRLEAAKLGFLDLDAGAVQALRDLLPEIDRLPLGPERWSLFWEARAWLARALQAASQRTAALEVLLQILRVDEAFQLDRVSFPPSTRELLESARARLPLARRFKLSISVRSGAGQVYLDGFAAGPTPFARAVAEGEYQLVVAEGSRRSFVRRLRVAADAELVVDLDREARFDGTAGPCVVAGGDRETRLVDAAHLGRVLKVQQLIAVRLEAVGGEPHVAAALIDAAKARELRDGRVRGEGADPASVGRLARFVLTGERTAVPQAASQEALASGARWQRPVAYALWGAAVVLGGIAVWAQVHAGELEKELASSVVDGAVVGSASRYHELRGAAGDARSLRTGLAIGAGAAAAAGTGLFVWSVLPGPEGPRVSVGVAGSF